MTRPILLLVLSTSMVLMTIFSFGQGNTCGAAANLPVNTTCTTQGFTNNQNGTAPEYTSTCATTGTGYEDVWFSVTGTGNPMTVTISNTDRAYVLTAMTTCTGGELDCTQQASGVTGSVTFPTTNGTTYYIHIQRRSGNNNANMSGDICAVSAAPAGSCSTDLVVGSTTYSNTGLTTCGAGDDFSSADACGSSYMNGDDYVIEYTPTTSECVTFDLTNTGTWVGIFLTDDCPDAVGANCLVSATESAGNPSMTYTVTAGTTYYITISTFPAPQCTAFDIDIAACPPPTACTADLTVSSTTYSNTGLTTCGAGDDYSSADACGSSYMNGDDYLIEYTPTTSECVQFSLSNTGTWVGIFLTDQCPDSPTATCLTSGTNSGGNPSMNYTVTAGTTYYITVSTFPAPQCTAFDLDISACPPPPPNDDCTGAIPLTVNPDNLCGTTTAGTIQNATLSAQATGCGGTADDDVWYSFVATNTSHYVNLLNVVGSTTDMYHSVYAGTCGTIGAPLVCSDPNASTVTGLTIGNTYYVRVYSWTGTSGQTSTFDICIGTPPPPPANDDCGGAINVPVSSGACTTVTSSVASATPSADPNGCFGTADDDVWFSFTATTTDAQIDLSNISGSTTDLYHSVYAGTCGSLGAELVCSDPNTSQVNSLTIGNVYFVRVYSYTATAGQTTVFDICVSEIGPCGSTSATEDFCPTAATLTQGPGSWTSSTYPYYTVDLPGNVNSVFCGSIENNSWYQFTALSTTEVFDITSVTNCINNFGIQAEVYDVTYDANGCCTNFTSMSNCFNPGTNSTGTVTATGLTIGNTYMLMFDGNAGDNCDFTITNWTATGIFLPVELIDFTAVGMSRSNIVSWKTASEQNSSHFAVRRSFDGINFETIGTVSAAGESSELLSYSFEDEDVKTGMVYYQLQQHDLNGQINTSELISLNRSAEHQGILSARPNPTENVLLVEIKPNSTHNRPVIQLMDGRGLIVRENMLNPGELNIVNMNLSELSTGVYFLMYTDNEGITYSEKILKK